MEKEKQIRAGFILCFVCIFFLAGAGLMQHFQISEMQDNTAKFMQDNAQIKSDLNQMFTNQKALEANQLGVKQLADETNVNQQLAERFFDNMIIELILTNDLKTTGEALRKHEEDLNALRALGYFGGN